MYLDPKKIIYGVGLLIFGLMAWWFTEQKNAATRELIEEIDAGAPGGEEALAIVRRFDAALSEGRRQLEAGAFRAGAVTLYRPFSTFENLLRGRPTLELENGQTLEAWFADKQAAFRPVVADAYQRVLAGLAAGDLSRDDARSFVSQIPYPFKGDLERQFRSDLEPIRTARAEAADGWVLVRAGASFGHGQAFEEAVEEAIRRRWPADSPYKLVVGRPMSDAEERAAAKVYQVYMTGETVRYAAEEAAFRNRGSGELLTTVTVEWIDRSRNPDALALNWDDLEPVTVRVEVPEAFTVRFENERQLADFDAVEAEHRAKVVAALEQAITAWPQAKVLNAQP
ncbi:MAG: hypothetical protein ACFE0O_06715 [Opitutales bacterium]